MISESVANAAKHSEAHDVAVQVEATRSGVEVTVEDRGRGFRTPMDRRYRRHLGLEMMRRRVPRISMEPWMIESTPGKGTRVVARLPVGERGENVRILIVDDHALVRRGMGYVVKEWFPDAESWKPRAPTRRST